MQAKTIPLFLRDFIQNSNAQPPVPAGSEPAATAATTGSAAPMTQPQPPTFMSFLPFVAIIVVFYFFMIRPQQKRMKEQQAMIGALKEGDEVVTSAGILGKIAGIAERVVTLEIAANVKIKVLKSQIAQVVKGSIKELAP